MTNNKSTDISSPNDGLIIENAQRCGLLLTQTSLRPIKLTFEINHHKYINVLQTE